MTMIRPLIREPDVRRQFRGVMRKPVADASYLNLLNSIPQGFSFTRGSGEGGIGAGGIFSQLANDIPSFEYDFVSGRPLGILLERGTTNKFDNNTFSGGTVGTTALPTTLAVETSVGLVTTLVGKGTENGFSYIDLNIAGTSSGVYYQIRYGFGSASSIGQKWTAQARVRMVAGTTAGVNGVSVVAREVGGSYGGEVSPYFNLNSNPAEMQYATYTLTGNYAAQWILRAGLVNGSSINITLRIYAPQLENLGQPTRFNQSASARSADSLILNDLSTFEYNQNEGTFIVTFNKSEAPQSGSFPELITLNDGSVNNTMFAYNAPGSLRINFKLTVGGVTYIDTQPPNDFLKTSKNKFGFSYKNGDYKWALNNGNVMTSSAAVEPPAVNRMYFGGFSGCVESVLFIPKSIPTNAFKALLT